MNKNYKYYNGKLIVGTDEGLVESDVCVDNIGARLAVQNEISYFVEKIKEEVKNLDQMSEDREKSLKFFRRYLGVLSGACVAAPFFITAFGHVPLEEIAVPLAISESIGLGVGSFFSLVSLLDIPSKKTIHSVKTVLQYEKYMLKKKSEELSKLEADNTYKSENNNLQDGTIYNVDGDTSMYDDFIEVFKDCLERKMYFTILYKMGKLEKYLRSKNCNEEALSMFMAFIEDESHSKEYGFVLAKRKFNV